MSFAFVRSDFNHLRHTLFHGKGVVLTSNEEGTCSYVDRERPLLYEDRERPLLSMLVPDAALDRMTLTPARGPGRGDVQRQLPGTGQKSGHLESDGLDASSRARPRSRSEAVAGHGTKIRPPWIIGWS